MRTPTKYCQPMTVTRKMMALNSQMPYTKKREVPLLDLTILDCAYHDDHHAACLCQPSSIWSRVLDAKVTIYGNCKDGVLRDEAQSIVHCEPPVNNIEEALINLCE